MIIYKVRLRDARCSGMTVNGDYMANHVALKVLREDHGYFLDRVRAEERRDELAFMATALIDPKITLDFEVVELYVEDPKSLS